jgi:tRNA pseudouridine55 synthase
VSQSEGLLVVDKPPGPTSHDVVAQARRLYATRAVGHAGTLDPMASGVMLLLFGQATKLSSYLTENAKRYRTVVRLGRSTDTLDAWGKTTEERELTGAVDRTLLAEALDGERARREQVPPEFSAIQVSGERAYRLSRRGQPPQLPPRAVRVLSLALESESDRDVTLTLEVSKGYYVRALARDLGARLGVPAHMRELRRLASGGFTLREAVPWPPPAPVELMPLAQAAARALPCAQLTSEGERRARLGQRLAADDFRQAPAVAVTAAWFNPDGDLVALGRGHEGAFVVTRGFTLSSR